MEYNLIGNNNILTPLETVLHNRGIEDVEQFLKAGEDKSVTNHYSKLRNIDKAVECLLEYIENNRKIFVQIDPDVDGVSSSTMLINYLTNLFPDIDIQWRMQDGKEHGIEAKHVPNNIDLVIVPDSGSSDYDQHKKLQKRNIDVIILDHHLTEKESEYAIVVNNQISPDFSNKDFSGAGVVFKFLEALDDRLKVSHADDYLDLVALGNVGDLMDTRSLETRYYITQGLKKLNNPLLKELFKEQEYSTKGNVNPTTVGWYISPLPNSVLRSGTPEEKEQMFKAFLDDGTTEVYYERGKRDEPLITNTIRMMKRVRVRQNKLRDEGVELIEERIKEKDLLDNKALIVEVTDILDGNLSGLVANRLIDRYKRPVLLPRFNEETNTYDGSARNLDNGHIKDLRQYLLDTGKFEYARGHSSAFGFSIFGENLIEVNNQINEDLKNIESHTGSYDVDFVLSDRQVKKSLVEELDSYKDVWGRAVEEPLIVVEDIIVSKSSVQLLGKNKNTIKFTSNGIEYMKFFTNEEEYKELMNMGSSVDNLNFTVCGSCSINEFRGRKTGQIVIEDYMVSSEKQGLPF